MTAPLIPADAIEPTAEDMADARSWLTRRLPSIGDKFAVIDMCAAATAMAYTDLLADSLKSGDTGSAALAVRRLIANRRAYDEVTELTKS